ncbi:MAG: hypothetical protein ABMA14_20340 [Hyphomonadaceae bacterium]
MTTCVYTFEIPDLSRPIANATEMSPSGELAPFSPEPLDPDKIVGRRILGVIANAGTYGMGGPGFFALKLDPNLGADWLVIALWGAASWMTCQGRLVEDLHFDVAGRPQPWMSDTVGIGALEMVLAGKRIESVSVAPRAMRIGISRGLDLTIADDVTARPVFGGNGLPRAFTPDDDLRRAVFLSPTIELWV